MAVQYVSRWRLREFNQRAAWLRLAAQAKKLQEARGATVRHLAETYSGAGGGMTFIHIIESESLAAHEAFMSELLSDAEFQELLPLFTPVAELIAQSLFADAPLPE
jgi:hypothetical protein